jgi:hypothetical protein
MSARSARQWRRSVWEWGWVVGVRGADTLGFEAEEVAADDLKVATHVTHLPVAESHLPFTCHEHFPALFHCTCTSTSACS